MHTQYQERLKHGLSLHERVGVFLRQVCHLAGSLARRHRLRPVVSPPAAAAAAAAAAGTPAAPLRCIRRDGNDAANLAVLWSTAEDVE